MTGRLTRRRGNKSRKSRRGSLSRKSRTYKQYGGTFKDDALEVLKKNNIVDAELRNFMTDLYKNKTTKTVDNIIFKVIKKEERYFDIFNLYLMAKKGGLFSSFEEIMKVDFGSGSLS